MNRDINLALGKSQIDLKEKQRINLIKNIAFGFLAFTLLLSIILFILIQATSTSSIKKDQDSVLRNLSFLQEKAVKLSFVQDRLLGISQISKKRKDYTKTINSILQKIPAEASVNVMEIDKDSILLSVSSLSLLSIDRFTNSFIEISQKDKIIKNLSIEGLTADKQNGRYTISLKGKLL